MKNYLALSDAKVHNTLVTLPFFTRNPHSHAHLQHSFCAVSKAIINPEAGNLRSDGHDVLTYLLLD